MCCEIEKNGFLTVSAVIFILLQSAVMADWSASSAFDYDGDGIIGLGDFAIFASHWGQMEPELSGPDVAWVYIDDSGVDMKDSGGNPISKGGFSGYMSRYETTNSQYAHYLNDALSTGDIWVDGNNVKCFGGEYNGQTYYRLDGPGEQHDGATNGGKSRIIYSWANGAFTVENGFENHPVTYISWYGATAFATYYGWRLPTEWEWQAVADYDGSYIYGCGNPIDISKANYFGSTHPAGTTVVGAYGNFGYGLADMAGNVWEWTSTASGIYQLLRGGSWPSGGNYCSVSYRYNYNPPFTNSNIGFRVCR